MSEKIDKFNFIKEGKEDERDRLRESIEIWRGIEDNCNQAMSEMIEM